MASTVYFLLFTGFIVAIIHSVTSESSDDKPCPTYEHMESCLGYSLCQRNCDNYKEKKIPCPNICVKGCICDDGLIRGPNKKCIRPDKCPAKENGEGQKCPPQEHYTRCGFYCQKKCDNYHDERPCKHYCLGGCICNDGLVRGPNKDCIRKENCPAKPNPEEWDVERSSVNPLSYTDEVHYSRDRITLNNELAFSPRSQNCPTNEHFDVCGAHPLCQKNCDMYERPFPCTMACNSGCICDEGFIRGPDNTCVRPDDCPAKPNAERQEWDVETSSVNPHSYTLYSRDRTTESPEFASYQTTTNCPTDEHFHNCGANPLCQRNCDNYNKLIPCTMACVPGCICNDGLIRGPENTCIKPDSCPAKANAEEWDVETSSANRHSYTLYSRDRTTESPEFASYQSRFDCPTNETYSSCDANCNITCDNYKKPMPCPKACVWGCVCEIGFVRGPEEKCIRKEDCPAKSNAEAQHFDVTLNPPPYTDDDYHIPDSVTENPNFEETEIPPISNTEPDHQCPKPRERWVACGSHCQRNCSNKDDRDFDCRPVCIPGCICEEGLVKGPGDKCIEKDKCPTKSDSEGSFYVTLNPRPYTNDDDHIPDSETENPHFEETEIPPISNTNYDFQVGGNPCPVDEACGKLCRNIDGMTGGKCIGPNNITCQCY